MFCRLCSPERALLEKAAGAWGVSGVHGGSSASAGALYVPDCEEVRVSAAVARRGYLNVLQHGTHGWKKRWLVSELVVYSLLVVIVLN